jgi:hypothetical protein
MMESMRDDMPTIAASEFANYLDYRTMLVFEIVKGLRGQPFCWVHSEYQAVRKTLKALGITLITKGEIQQLGGQVDKQVKPVGTIYFPAPVDQSADVYVLECQVWMPSARTATAETH